MIVKMGEGSLETKFGRFREILYYDGQKESIAMIMGDVNAEEDVLCRVHSSCVYGHYFNSIECDCQEQLNTAQQLIQQQGKGIIILQDQEGKGNGHYALLKSIEHKKQGVEQSKAYELAGFKKDARDFGAAAKILKEIGVKSVRMITNNGEKVNTLTQFGIKVLETKSTIL